MATFTFRQRGFRQEPAGQPVLLSVYNSGAVTDGQILGIIAVPFNAYIVGAFAHAGIPGSGSGNTTIALDTLDGAGSGRLIADNTPMALASADTGYFSAPSFESREIQAGELLRINVSGIPATAGHQRVGVTVMLVPR